MKPPLKSQVRAHLVGSAFASLALASLLISGHGAGLPVPAKMVAARFSVAMLSGVKQAAQQAPENVTTQAEATQAASPSETAVVAVNRESSLPQAVAAAQEAATATKTDATPDEVIPPSRISMPGGRMAVEDAPVGNEPDPFKIGPRQVYVRLLVNTSGDVVRGGIVRSGPEPMRDALILRAVKSRTYATKHLLPAPSQEGEPLWQVDLVLDYDSASALP